MYNSVGSSILYLEQDLDNAIKSEVKTLCPIMIAHESPFCQNIWDSGRKVWPAPRETVGQTREICYNKRYHVESVRFGGLSAPAPEASAGPAPDPRTGLRRS